MLNLLRCLNYSFYWFSMMFNLSSYNFSCFLRAYAFSFLYYGLVFPSILINWSNYLSAIWGLKDWCVGISIVGSSVSGRIGRESIIKGVTGIVLGFLGWHGDA